MEGSSKGRNIKQENSSSSDDSDEPTPGPSRENSQTDSNSKRRKFDNKESDSSNGDVNVGANLQTFLADIQDSETDPENEEGSLSSGESGSSSSDLSVASLFSGNPYGSMSSDFSSRSSQTSESETASEPESVDFPSQERIPDFLLIPNPKHTWSAIHEIRMRELGYSNYKTGYKAFQNKMYGSLHAVQRLKLMHKMKRHTGCVNGIHFNRSGELLASCSDDLRVCLWNWASGTLQTKIKTPHKSNVFQAKFLPLDGSITLATCARDGAVCLISMDQSGSARKPRCIGMHSRAAHKLSFIAGAPPCFMSCGEDGTVKHFDTRQKGPIKVLQLINDGKVIELYSISCHPTELHEFMLGGNDKFLRLYDRRNILKPLYKLTPSHLNSVKAKYLTYITSALYNHDGTQFLASYKDDDIFLWDRKDMSNNDAVHRYQGHQNCATIKGVNFFGPRSEYVVSGSDCGNIFFWDRECEAVVMWIRDDKMRTVNCIESHPTIPILATSGLDSDVKIWIPSSEDEPVLEGLVRTVNSNFRRRNRERRIPGVSELNSRYFSRPWRQNIPVLYDGLDGNYWNQPF